MLPLTIIHLDQDKIQVFQQGKHIQCILLCSHAPASAAQGLPDPDVTYTHCMFVTTVQLFSAAEKAAAFPPLAQDPQHHSHVALPPKMSCLCWKC